MLIVNIPDYQKTEIKWIVDTILGDFFDLEYIIQIREQNYIVLRKDNKALSLRDSFFLKSKSDWLKKSSLPVQPLSQWDTSNLDFCINVTDHVVPIIYGGQINEVTSNNIKLSLDIFGSAFFMLTRYEEAVKSDRDCYDRFPAKASLSYQEGFIDRPIINEYIEILWGCINYLWPDIERKKRSFRMLVSCDVDMPYSHGVTSIFAQFKQIAGDLIKRKSSKLAIGNLRNFLATKNGDYSLDHFYTFDWMMSICEENKIKCAFYFLCNKANGTYYDIDEPVIKELLNNIFNRGHEIGLHTSYSAYLSSQQVINELKKLKATCQDISIIQKKWGVRQHGLRWKTPETFQDLDAAGLDYDTTLGFPERAGFRSGICYEYQSFDLKSRQMLKIKERPLVLMEVSVLKKRYMDMGYTEDSLEYMLKIKDRCKQFDGDFTLLWHNSSFQNKLDKVFYKALCEDNN